MFARLISPSTWTPRWFGFYNIVVFFSLFVLQSVYVSIYLFMYLFALDKKCYGGKPASGLDFLSSSVLLPSMFASSTHVRFFSHFAYVSVCLSVCLFVCVIAQVV